MRRMKKYVVNPIFSKKEKVQNSSSSIGPPESPIPGIPGPSEIGEQRALQILAGIEAKPSPSKSLGLSQLRAPSDFKSFLRSITDTDGRSGKDNSCDTTTSQKTCVDQENEADHVDLTKERDHDSGEDSQNISFSDEEIVIDFDEKQEESEEYYENVIFQTGKRSSSLTQDSQYLDIDYEDVELKIAMPSYENVNYNNSAKNVKDEGFYTMGRRFPSIRLKSKDKKDAKKIGAGSCASSDKAVEVNGSKGSCVRATSAIYGDSEDFESNIYENGLIVIKQNVQNNKNKCCGLRWGFGSQNPKNPKKSNNTESRNPCGGKKPKQYLIATVILSVIVFVLTGASLLITRGSGSFSRKDVNQEHYIINQWKDAKTNELSTKSNADLSWGTWSPWSQCSIECKLGESQARSRLCRNEYSRKSSSDLKPCLSQGGSNIEIRICPCSSDNATERIDESLEYQPRNQSRTRNYYNY